MAAFAIVEQQAHEQAHVHARAENATQLSDTAGGDVLIEARERDWNSWKTARQRVAQFFCCCSSRYQAELDASHL